MDFGEGMYTPPPIRPQERSPFLHTTLRSFLLGFLTLDLLDASIKLIPGIGNLRCGSIFSYTSRCPPASSSPP